MKAKAPAATVVVAPPAHAIARAPRSEEPVPDTSHLARTPNIPAARTDATPPEPGRLLRDADKTAFLPALREAITVGASEELAGTGWSAEQCPYIEYWFAYYAHRSAGEIEAALRKYAPASILATTLDGYIDPVVARVRAAIAHWKATAEIDAPAVEVPEVRAQLAALGPGEPLDSATRTRFEGAMQTNLSRTRIHRDGRGAAASSAAGARAFAIGEHVAFGAGQYAPGTPHGDALLAHELAHTQQQDASRGASTGAPLEHAADRSAKSWLARLWGFASGLTRPTMPTTGLQLQRCKGESHELSELGIEDDSKESQVGFVTSPDMHKRADGEVPGVLVRSSAGATTRLDRRWFAVVGQKVTFDVANANPNYVTSIARMEYAKVENDRAVAMKYTSSHEVTFDSVGTWVVWAGGRVNGSRGYSIHRVVNVIDPAAYAKQAAEVQVGSQSLPPATRGVTAYLRMQIALQERMASQFGAVKNQYAAGPYLESDAPNPVGTKEREVTYRVKHVPKEAVAFKWGRSHDGAPTHSDPGQQHLWSDLGTTTVPEKKVLNLMYGPGAYDYTCTILDASGNTLGTATYKQMVVFEKEMGVANQWLSYLAGSKTTYEKLKSPMQLPGAFVNGATGEAMPLYMFVGESKTKPGTWIVLDLTPDASKGGGPKAHEFSGPSLDSALASFKSNASERYPKGRLHLMTSILPGQAGDMTFGGGKTSWLRDLADWMGLASIGWTLAGFTAVIFGAEPLAMVFFGLAAGTGAVSSAAIVAERIRSGDADAMGYFLDVAGFAVSVIGAGQAYTGYKHALAAAKGGAAAEVAVSTAGRKFVQWTEQKLVQSTAILITAESVVLINEIATDPTLGDEEKAARIASLFRQIALQVGILSVSRRAKVPPALEERANKLAAVERQVLNTLDDGALDQLARMPDDIKPAIALALDHPAQVNAALKSGKVKSIAELEAAVRPAPSAPKPPVEVPAAKDVTPPPAKGEPQVVDTTMARPPRPDRKAKKAKSSNLIVEEPPVVRPMHVDNTATTQPETPDITIAPPPTTKPAVAKPPTTAPPTTAAARQVDGRTAAEAKQDPEQLRRYNRFERNAKTKLDFDDWWGKFGRKPPPNPHGKPGKPDHVSTIDDKLEEMARKEFPDDIIVKGESIQGRKTPKGKTIRINREPDVTVIDATDGKTVKKVYEAARTNADGSLVSREVEKQKQYNGLGVPSHFEPVQKK